MRQADKLKRPKGPTTTAKERSKCQVLAQPSAIGPKRRKFLVTLLVEIDIDQSLLDDVLTDEWRKSFYGDVRTAEDVADHLAFNLAQNRRLSSLDGFADQSEDQACVMSIEVDAPAVEVDAKPVRAPAQDAKL